jgi:hypothetical protein
MGFVRSTVELSTATDHDGATLFRSFDNGRVRGTMLVSFTDPEITEQIIPERATYRDYLATAWWEDGSCCHHRHRN